MILYDPRELRFLLRQWKSGMLDQITDRGSPKVGLRGAVVMARGVVGQTLVERFTSDEVSAALGSLFEKKPEAAAGLILVHALDKPIEALAAGLGTNCSEAGYRLMCFEDALIRELYGIEEKQNKGGRDPFARTGA